MEVCWFGPVAHIVRQQYCSALARTVHSFDFGNGGRVAFEAGDVLTALACARVFHTQWISEWSATSNQELMASCPNNCLRSAVETAG